MDPVRQLFEVFSSGGATYLEQVVDNQTPESLYLEFKRAENNEAPMTRKDKQKLAEALSGFANSEGGVVVWGIYAAASSADEPDVAKKLQPIKNLPLFLSNLETNAAQVVSPGIVGLEHFAIPNPSQPDSGFVVTYVPRSEAELHMAVATDQHRYYYRTTSSFLKMEAYMVADRYGRRPQPRLELAHTLEYGGHRESSAGGGQIVHYRIRVSMGLKNTGLGIALYPALALDVNRLSAPEGQLGQPAPGFQTRPRMPGGDGKHFYTGSAGTVIHPGVTFHIVYLEFEVTVPLRPTELSRLEISLPYELYCQGFFACNEARISPSEVERFVLSLPPPR